jgi:hypothetical protein
MLAVAIAESLARRDDLAARTALVNSDEGRFKSIVDPYRPACRVTEVGIHGRKSSIAR